MNSYFDWQNWESWPYEKVLRARAYILLKSGDPELRTILKTLCSQDPIFFFTFFCYTKDPKKTPANLPFIPYPYEKDLIRWVENHLKNKTDALVEKSRQMGITWTIMTLILWHYLFDHDFVTICGSRKEELVDKRDKDDTLFYKLDYNLQRLPRWLLPKRYNPTKDRRHLLLVNRERENTIIGESSNENFGRGGSENLAFLDELGTWPEASASWAAVSEAAQTKLAISTARPFCFFKTLRFSKQIDVKTIHWRLHPEKDDAWYQKQKETKSAELLAQEIDISYDVTGRGKVYPEFDDVPIGHYPYNPKLPLYDSTDFGFRDPTSIIWVQKDENKVYVIDSYENTNKTIDFYIPFYTGKIPVKKRHLYTTEEIRKIREHRKWKRAIHIGDPAGKARNIVTGDKSAVKILADAGVYMRLNDKASSFVTRREATKRLLPYLYVDEKNTHFIECIQQSRYPEVRINSQRTTPVLRPIHNWTAHARTALEFLAVTLKLGGKPPRRINYLKGKVKLDEDGKLHEDQVRKEKKSRLIRYSWRSYKNG